MPSVESCWTLKSATTAKSLVFSLKCFLLDHLFQPDDCSLRKKFVISKGKLVNLHSKLIFIIVFTFSLKCKYFVPILSPNSVCSS